MKSNMNPPTQLEALVTHGARKGASPSNAGFDTSAATILGSYYTPAYISPEYSRNGYYSLHDP